MVPGSLCVAVAMKARRSVLQASLPPFLHTTTMDRKSTPTGISQPFSSWMTYRSVLREQCMLRWFIPCSP
jgi:hypothetical protein